MNGGRAMKKNWKIILLCTALAALLCVFAFAAAAPTDSGIYNIVEKTGATITCTGTPATVEIDGVEYSDFYANAEKLTVTYAGTDGNQYLIFALKPGETVPTADSLIYIDQAQCVSGNAAFTVFPSELNVGTNTLYISGTGLGYTKIGSFDYYAAGVTVSGQVTSYNPNNPVTIQIKDGSTVIASTTIAATTGSGKVTQAFSIEKVPAGTYDLVVTKDAHLTYTVKDVVVGDTDLDLTAATSKAYSNIVMLVGDVDDSGTIDADDLAILWNEANYNKAATSAGNALTDLDGSNTVDADDLAILWNEANYNKGTSNCTYSF